MAGFPGRGQHASRSDQAETGGLSEQHKTEEPAVPIKEAKRIYSFEVVDTSSVRPEFAV
jgi:hypothetical protein